MRRIAPDAPGVVNRDQGTIICTIVQNKWSGQQGPWALLPMAAFTWQGDRKL
jgi:hypothetical protein